MRKLRQILPENISSPGGKRENESDQLAVQNILLREILVLFPSHSGQILMYLSSGLCTYKCY